MTLRCAQRSRSATSTRPFYGAGSIRARRRQPRARSSRFACLIPGGNEAGAVVHRFQIEMRCEALPDISKGIATTERPRLEHLATDQYRDVFTCVIATVPGRVAAVIGT